MLEGSWNQESTRAPKKDSRSSSSSALAGTVTQSGQRKQQQAGSVDNAASSALTEQHDIYRSVPGGKWPWPQRLRIMSGPEPAQKGS